MLSGRSKSNRGFTLVEIMVALAVIGVMAGAFVGVNSMLNSSKVNTVIRQISAIREAADRYTEATGAVNYWWVSPWNNGIDRLIGGGYLPSSIRNGPKPFGEQYEVWVNDGAGTRLIVYVGGLPWWAQQAVVNNFSRSGSPGASCWGCYWAWVVF